MDVKTLIKASLQEDIKSGDVTSGLFFKKKDVMSAKITAKESGILAGIGVACDVFLSFDKNVKFKALKKDGSSFKKGDVIAEVKGKSISVLSCERTALNFLQHLSGIATKASLFAQKVSHTKARILDTRKTIPGLRELEKHATKMGGVKNHRQGLYDMILIKDNHIKAAGGFEKMLKILETKKPEYKVEVEVENAAQLKLLLKSRAKVDVVMLDNHSLADLRNALKLIRQSKKKIKTECSGNVNLKTVAGIAKTGVDFISVGSSLTLSSKAIDFSMR